MGKIVRIELADKINKSKVFLGVENSSVDDEVSPLVFGVYKNEVSNDNKETIEWELDMFSPDSFLLRSVLQGSEYLTVVGNSATGELKLGVKTIELGKDEYSLFSTKELDADRVLITSLEHPTFAIAVNTSGFRPAFLLPMPMPKNFLGEWLLTYL